MSNRVMTLVLIAATACAEDAQEKDPIIRSVRYVVATNFAGGFERTLSGQIQASDEARLSFQVTGRVEEVRVKMGDRVKAGQVLATLDPADFRLDVQSARATLARLRAEAVSASSTYRRTKKLFENRNASVADLDEARASRDSAASAAAAQAQEVKQLQRQLGYATLKAPSDGIIREVSIEENEVISAGESIGRLQAGDQLEVNIDVPETFIGRLERGQDVSVVLTTLRNQKTPGVVSEIGVAGPSSAAYPVFVRLVNYPEAVEAGMAADVVFTFEPLDGGENLFRVPTTAVGEDRKGTFIYVLEQSAEDLEKEEGIVRRQSIQTGGIESDGIDVIDGLSEGKKVVTAGVARIYDGLRVRVPRIQETYDR